MGAPADRYVWPFSGGTPGRVDQGLDWDQTPGTPIRAIGHGRITQILTGYGGYGTVIVYRLFGGPKAGHSVFVGHAVPAKGIGQGSYVAPGQTIAVANQAAGSSGRAGHVEMGWWDPAASETLARSRGDVDPTTHYSREGQDFADWVRALNRAAPAPASSGPADPAQPSSAAAAASGCAVIVVMGLIELGAIVGLGLAGWLGWL